METGVRTDDSVPWSCASVVSRSTGVEAQMWLHGDAQHVADADHVGNLQHAARMLGGSARSPRAVPAVSRLPGSMSEPVTT